MRQIFQVPQTPLHTNRILNEENEQWPEVQEEMNRLAIDPPIDRHFLTWLFFLFKISCVHES